MNPRASGLFPRAPSPARAALLGLVMITLASALPAPRAADDTSWAMTRVRVSPSEGVPAARYTLMETIGGAERRRARLLFTPYMQAQEGVPPKAGLPLVLESKKKDLRGMENASYWLTLREATGEELLTLERVGELAALGLRGERVVELVMEGPPGPLVRGAIGEVLRALGEERRASLESLVRVLLAREPALYGEAELLVRVLFPELMGLPLDAKRREELAQVVDFDPLRHPPTAIEAPFGALYRPPFGRGSSSPLPGAGGIRKGEGAGDVGRREGRPGGDGSE